MASKDGNKKAAEDEKAAVIAEAKALKDLEEKYKASHGAIGFTRTLDDEGKPIILWYKQPHRSALGAAMAVLEHNTIEACEYIFDSALIPELSPEWEKVRNHNGRFMGICIFLQALGGVKKSTYRIF